MDVRRFGVVAAAGDGSAERSRSHPLRTWLCSHAGMPGVACGTCT